MTTDYIRPSFNMENVTLAYINILYFFSIIINKLLIDIYGT